MAQQKENITTVLNLPEAENVGLEDVLYLIQGEGSDRDRKVTVRALQDRTGDKVRTENDDLQAGYLADKFSTAESGPGAYGDIKADIYNNRGIKSISLSVRKGTVNLDHLDQDLTTGRTTPDAPAQYIKGNIIEPLGITKDQIANDTITGTEIDKDADLEIKSVTASSFAKIGDVEITKSTTTGAGTSVTGVKSLDVNNFTNTGRLVLNLIDLANEATPENEYPLFEKSGTLGEIRFFYCSINGDSGKTIRYNPNSPQATGYRVVVNWRTACGFIYLGKRDNINVWANISGVQSF